MYKRLFSWIVALSLIFSSIPVYAGAAGSTLSEAERYTQYLKNGGYKTIMDDTVSKSDLQVKSVLADVDGDDVLEALVQLSDLSTMGPRGYQTHCAVLDIENDAVVIRLQTFYGGGTLGGDMLNLEYDAQQKKHVITLDSSIRDGMNAGSTLTQMFNTSYEVVLEVEYYFISLDATLYQDRINKVKSETSLYKVNNYDQFVYWTVDGKYVSEETYTAQRDRFVLPDPEKDEPYSLFDGTYDKPIKIKTVPEGYDFKEDSYHFENYKVDEIDERYFRTMYVSAVAKLLHEKYSGRGNKGVCFGMSYTTASIFNNKPGIECFENEILDNYEKPEKIRDLYRRTFATINETFVTVGSYIQYAHIYQVSSNADKAIEKTKNDINGLMEQVRKYLDEDKLGVVIGFIHEGSAHAVLAVGIEGNAILIDDPNNTSRLERMTVQDDGSWTYTGNWAGKTMSNKNTSICYFTDLDMPYMALYTGLKAPYKPDGEETIVEGMKPLDADKVLLAVESDHFKADKTLVPVIFIDEGSSDSNLYWVNSGTSVTLSNLTETENQISLAGNDDLMRVTTAKGSKVTMTVSDPYTGLLLKAATGDSCTVSLENTASDGEDVIITISGTVTNGTVVFAKDDNGVNYSGLSDVTVTLTKGEDNELSQTVTEEGTSIYVDYTADDTAFALETGANDTPVNPFVDVTKGRFYYDSVLWAVNDGITAGVTETTFEPEKTCTRDQVVTFLWRAAGSPEPASTQNPFTDVKEGQFHYKAVLWAVENGITMGMSADTFGSKESCTRGQVATFLWRTLNNPEASSRSHPFTDLAEGKYYYDAVLWAVENNVTSGMTATTFAPEKPCTRGQIVTFLNRALN